MVRLQELPALAKPVVCVSSGELVQIALLSSRSTCPRAWSSRTRIRSLTPCVAIGAAAVVCGCCRCHQSWCFASLLLGPVQAARCIGVPRLGCGKIPYGRRGFGVAISRSQEAFSGDGSVTLEFEFRLASGRLALAGSSRLSQRSCMHLVGRARPSTAQGASCLFPSTRSAPYARMRARRGSKTLHGTNEPQHSTGCHQVQDSTGSSSKGHTLVQLRLSKRTVKVGLRPHDSPRACPCVPHNLKRILDRRDLMLMST